MSEVTMLSPEHDETCTISKLLNMYNFFTNAKNVFTACLNELNKAKIYLQNVWEESPKGFLLGFHFASSSL